MTDPPLRGDGAASSGFSVCVRVSKKASVRKLRATIVRALADPALKEGARAMSLALARSDGALKVAEAVERIGQTPCGGAPHTVSNPAASCSPSVS